MHTNLPVKGATDILSRELYSSDEALEIPKTAMQRFLRLAVTIVHFNCNKLWYTQWDGLAMGASLVKILANFWMKSFGRSFQRPNEGQQNSWHENNVHWLLPTRYFSRKKSHAKTGFTQNSRVSMTRCRRTYRKLYGSIPIVQKNVPQRTQSYCNNSRSIWMT